VDGELRGGWNDVDEREMHWYWESFPPALLGIPFDSTALIEVFEVVGQDRRLIGRVLVGAYEINQGQHEGLASQGSDDGRCVVRYQVSA